MLFMKQCINNILLTESKWSKCEPYFGDFECSHSSADSFILFHWKLKCRDWLCTRFTCWFCTFTTGKWTFQYSKKFSLEIMEKKQRPNTLWCLVFVLPWWHCNLPDLFFILKEEKIVATLVFQLKLKICFVLAYLFLILSLQFLLPLAKHHFTLANY